MSPWARASGFSGGHLYSHSTGCCCREMVLLIRGPATGGMRMLRSWNHGILPRNQIYLGVGFLGVANLLGLCLLLGFFDDAKPIAAELPIASKSAATDSLTDARAWDRDRNREVLRATESAPLLNAALIESSANENQVSAPRASLEVRIVDFNGIASPGVSVRAKTKAYTLAEQASVIRHAITDSEGAARIEVLPGRVVVSAHREGIALHAAHCEVFCVGQGPFVVDMALQPTANVAGRVVDQESGKGLSGVEVQCSNRKKLGLDPAITGGDGCFNLQGWPLDVMTGLKTRAEGFGEEQVKLAITSNGAWEIPARFGWETKAGDGGTPWVEVTLVPEKTVVGTVRSRAGKIIEGATVSATGRFLTMAHMAHTDERRSTADIDGHFEISGLRSDITHSIRVRAPGYLDVAQIAAPNLIVDIGDVVLDVAYSVRGTIVDMNGQGIPGLRVECESVEDEIPHLEWDPENGTVSERDGFSGHYPVQAFGYTNDKGEFEVGGVNSERLALKVGQLRRPMHEEIIVRPSRGILERGQIVIEAAQVASCRVDLPQTSQRTALEAVIATTGGDAFSRVPCSTNGEFETWWPENCKRADVLIVHPLKGTTEMELRGVSLADLLQQ